MGVVSFRVLSGDHSSACEGLKRPKKACKGLKWPCEGLMGQTPLSAKLGVQIRRHRLLVIFFFFSWATTLVTRSCRLSGCSGTPGGQIRGGYEVRPVPELVMTASGSIRRVPG